MAGSALVSGFSRLFCQPLELATTVLSADVFEPQLGRKANMYSGMVDVYRKTREHSGAYGLYAGFGAHLLASSCSAQQASAFFAL